MSMRTRTDLVSPSGGQGQGRVVTIRPRSSTTSSTVAAPVAGLRHPHVGLDGAPPEGRAGKLHPAHLHVGLQLGVPATTGKTGTPAPEGEEIPGESARAVVPPSLTRTIPARGTPESSSRTRSSARPRWVRGPGRTRPPGPEIRSRVRPKAKKRTPKRSSRAPRTSAPVGEGGAPPEPPRPSPSRRRGGPCSGSRPRGPPRSSAGDRWWRPRGPGGGARRGRGPRPPS
jgi:hypothetical protein